MAYSENCARGRSDHRAKLLAISDPVRGEDWDKKADAGLTATGVPRYGNAPRILSGDSNSQRKSLQVREIGEYGAMVSDWWRG